MKRLFENKIHLFPRSTISLSSDENATTILTRIEKSILYKREFSITMATRSVKEFEGHVQGSTFSVRRVLGWGYSAFLVIASGEIVESDTGGSNIQIDFTFHRYVAWFLGLMVLWSVLDCFVGMRFVSSGSSVSSGLTNTFFIYTGIVIVFNYELSRIKTYLLGVGIELK